MPDRRRAGVPPGPRGRQLGPRDLTFSGARQLEVVAGPRMGKTTTLVALASLLPRNYVVIDTGERGDWEWLAPTVTDPEDLRYEAVCRWVPDLGAVRHHDGPVGRCGGADAWCRGWRVLLEGRSGVGPDGTLRGVVVIVDEARDALPIKVPPIVDRAITKGEGQGLAIWAGTQSPYGVNRRWQSDAGQRFLGRIGGAQERGILAADWGVEIPDQVTECPEGSWYVHRPGGPLLGPWPLREILPAGIVARAAKLTDVDERARRRAESRPPALAE